MNNQSGGSRKRIEDKEIFTKHTQVIKYDSYKSKDEDEVNRIVDSFEKMKSDDSELFDEIMYINKQIMDLCSKEKSTREEIKELEDYFNDLEEINEDFLFWVSHKGIEKAIIDNKNIDIAHFLIVRKGYKLYNKIIHKNLLIEFIKSLSSIELEEDYNSYITILDFIINYGKADINEKDDSLQNTPLHYAVCYKQIPFICFLVSQNDIKLSEPNKYGETPLDFATESLSREEDATVNSEIVQLLLSSGALPNTCKHMYEEEKN